MASVIVYIDGFNLYYGALKRTPYKWLDLGRLCSIMLPNDNILAINHYTARISARPGNPSAPTDQRHCAELKRVATFLKRIRQSDLVGSQFPPVLHDRHGDFHKPPSW